ncbi:MAK10-like protein [Tanacetum coccineum]
MGDEIPIRTLGDYSKPSHEGYMNTIELLVGNNVVPLLSDTIRLLQNGCSFHRHRSEDPNQYLKDFLKLVDSLDLDGKNRERTRLCLFQFYLRDQASNWLERLPAGSITAWEDLTTCFLAQFFPPGRTAKLRNDILIWNDLRDFAKSVKAITLPQDVSSTSDRCLIELENQVQRLMEAHLALMQPTQVNKITTSCEICSGPHDTRYCMEDPEQAFVEYASSRTDEAREGLLSNFMASQDSRLSKFEADFKQQQSKMTNKIDIILKAITDRIAGTLPSDTTKNLKLSTSPVLSARMGIGMQQPEEPEPTLEDEFQDLHLNLLVLEVLAHAPVYNVILNKYMESLELGKNGSAFVQGEVSAKMEDPGLFTLRYRSGDSKPFDTLADLESCVNIIPLYLFKKLNIGLLEETDHIFGLGDETKSYPVGIVKDVEVHIGKLKLLNDFYVIDMKKEPKTPLLVGRVFLVTANVVIDYRMAKIAVGEGIARLYLTRRILEDLRMFSLTLGGRLNQLSHVSSPLLSKPGEYYNNCLIMECHVRWLWRNTFIGYAVTGSISINRGLIQAIPTSLPPQPIGKATKASILQRIPPGVQERSHFTYLLYLIVQNTNIVRFMRTMAGVDVNTLTMEQYLALSRENQALGMVKPKIRGNVNFKIKSQFMCKLKEDTFSGNKDKDSHDHIDRSRKQIGGQNSPRNYQYLGSSQEGLYLKAWEQYNDLLYKCSTHDINSHQKVNIFYKGLSTMNHQLLNSQGLIPMMRPAKALTAIQTMGDHSQKWHDSSTSRNIRSSSSKDGLAALVGCQICEGPHLDKDCPLNKEVKQVEVVRYGEFGRTKPFNGNNGGRQTLTKTKSQNHHNEIIQGLKSRVKTLAKEAVTKIDNNKDCKAIFTNDGAPLYTPFYYSLEEIEYFLANFGFSDDDELNNVTSIPEEDLKQTSPKQITTHYVEPYIPPIPFPKRLEQHAE